MPAAVLKFGELNCIRYIFPSGVPKTKWRGNSFISSFLAFNVSNGVPNRSFFQVVNRASRPETKFVNSEMFVGATIKNAVAVITEMGAFRSAFLAAFMSCSSFHANANPTTISADMPSIKITHPISPRHLAGLRKGALNFSFFHSAIFSNNNPINTIIPPIEAATGKPQDDENSDTPKKFIFSIWGVCCLSVVAFGLINVAFGIYRIFSCRRK